MTTSRIFRSHDQWQSIIDEFSASGLSAPKFCQINKVPYGSFSKWRKKLTAPSHPREPKSSQPSFLDLGSLAPEPNSTQWHITLKLGNGVELVLSQA